MSKLRELMSQNTMLPASIILNPLFQPKLMASQEIPYKALMEAERLQDLFSDGWT